MANGAPAPLFSLRQLELRHGTRMILHGFCWSGLSGQHWLLHGGNGAGKSLLTSILGARLIPHGGSVLLPPRVAEISPALWEDIIAEEQRRDDSDFTEGGVDPGTTAQLFLLRAGLAPEEARSALRHWHMEHALHTSLRQLSTGEGRKLLIAAALASRPQLLVLDGALDGLDADSSRQLFESIPALCAQVDSLVFTASSPQGAPAGLTHALHLDHCRSISCAPLADAAIRPCAATGPFAIPATYLPSPHFAPGEELIRMEGLSIRYGERTVLDQLHWSVRHGQHWRIRGPNGVGKTSLLNVVNADHPQAYGQPLWLFGRLRGSGESVWSIKRHIGLVSSALQLDHARHIGALEAVISGFHDSVGLHRQPSTAEDFAARAWMQALGISHLEQSLFDELSWGERRLCLIARAMVKAPALLILDEPLSGVDQAHRPLVLQAIDFLAAHAGVSILYVSHEDHDIPSCISHELDLTHTASTGQGCPPNISTLKSSMP